MVLSSGRDQWKHAEEVADTSPYCIMALDTIKNRIEKIHMYYSLDNLMSRGSLLNFVIGERGVGKSFSSKLFCIKDFIKNGHQFIYLRRYKEELSLACSSFFDDIQAAGFFDDLHFEVKGDKKLTKFLMDGEVIGYGIALSTSNILKSTPFPNVKTIVFDEFILDVGTYHYLKSEVIKMLDAIETIFRLRDGRVLFLGNSISIDNPYFNYFNLSLPYNSEFKMFKDGLICVNYIKNLEYRDKKRKSRFGRLIDGTSYGSYAIDNQMLRDSNDFIEKKGKNPRFWHILVMNKKKYGVWFNAEVGRLYISEDYDPSSLTTFAIQIDDHTPDTKFVSIRQNGYMKLLIEYYKNGDLYFENMKIKNDVVPVLRRCLSY